MNPAFKGDGREDEHRLFSVVAGNRSRGNGLELQEGKLRLERRRNILPLSVVQHGNGASPSLDMSKSRLDRLGWFSQG